MAVNYHEGETDPSGFRVWWNSSSLRDIFVPPYRQLLDGLVMTTTSGLRYCTSVDDVVVSRPASPSQHVRPTGLRSGWSDVLELITEQSLRVGV